MAKNGKRQESTISVISVAGYKSLAKEQRISIAPLTLLAGTNSSGKSSIMQPLLLMKQTLEASYDPGVFLLDGPNVQLTSARQAITKGKSRFTVGFHGPSGSTVEITYKLSKSGVEIVDMTVGPSPERRFTFFPGMSVDEACLEAAEIGGDWTDDAPVTVGRSRCFLTLQQRISPTATRWAYPRATFPVQNLSGNLIHIPGLRGNPERAYRAAGISDVFPGAFESYVASIIAHWQTSGAEDLLRGVVDDLIQLQLTSAIHAKQPDDTRVELLVGRLPNGQKTRTPDLVSIADVGLGVSQTLPVIVALRAAKPGQPVYIEQPELHLHPNAQWRLARILAAAALRGVRVIIETHSSLLLRGVQTLVATGYLPANDVALNWFSRDQSTGFSTVSAATLDRNGAFGDWPADFDQISMEADNQYLSAVGHRNLH